MTMTPTAILESCLYAPDLDAAERFYGRVLGLTKETREGDRHVFYRLSDQMLLIFNPAESRLPLKPGKLPVPPHGPDGPGHLCFRVAEGTLDAWRDRLAEHSIPIESTVTWPHGPVSLYVRDPAGNSVEFAEGRLWGFAADGPSG